MAVPKWEWKYMQKYQEELSSFYVLDGETNDSLEQMEKTLWFRVGPVFLEDKQVETGLWIDVFPNKEGMPLLLLDKKTARALIKHIDRGFRFSIKSKIVGLYSRMKWAITYQRYKLEDWLREL